MSTKENDDKEENNKLTNFEVSLLKKILKLSIGNPNGNGSIESIAIAILEGDRTSVIREFATAIKSR